jgi:hypothetical protein
VKEFKIRGRVVKLIEGRWGYAAQSSDMLRLLGVKRLPPEGMPERLIDGVRVYVRPLAFGPAPCARWSLRPRRSFQGLRVMAICDCGAHVAVGRMHQHVCRPRVRRYNVTVIRPMWGMGGRVLRYSEMRIVRMRRTKSEVVRRQIEAMGKRYGQVWTVVLVTEVQ